MMIAAVVALCGLLTQAAPAVRPTAPETKARAQVLLKEGTAAYARGQPEAALAAFQTAYDIYPSANLQFNIAQANRDLGRPVEALVAFERFLAGAHDAAPAILAEARQAVAEIKLSLGQLVITCATAGAEVDLDGNLVGKTPIERPVPVVPGRHRITIVHESFPPIFKDVQVSLGETQTVPLCPASPRQVAAPIPPPALRLTPSAPVDSGISSAPRAVVAPTRRPTDVWSRQTWRFWTGAGATLALTVAAAAVGNAADARFGELQTSCGRTGPGCTVAQIDSVKWRASLANVLWGLAGTSAVLSGAVFYIDGRETGVSIGRAF